MSERRRSIGWLAVVVAYWAMQILYLLSPIDLIPDFLPVVGAIDDLAGLLSAAAMTAFAVWRAAPALTEEPGPTLAGRVERPDVYEPIPTEELRSL